MSKTKKETFSQRLVRIRKAKGLAQFELADRTGFSRRMIAHYETKAKNPSPSVVTKLTKALNITIDELMGHKPIKMKEPAINRSLLKRLRQMEKLPTYDKKTITNLINALVAKNRNRK